METNKERENYTFEIVFKCDYCKKSLLKLGFRIQTIEDLFNEIVMQKTIHKIRQCDGCRVPVRVEYILNGELLGDK